MAQIAEETGIGREALYKAKALGVKLVVQPAGAGTTSKHSADVFADTRLIQIKETLDFSAFQAMI